MFLITLLPDQAPTDSEKVFYSLPSYKLCAVRSSQVLIHDHWSHKSGLSSKQQRKDCIQRNTVYRFTHHYWSCRADVCDTGIPISLYQERSWMPSPTCTPNLDLASELVFFSFFFLTTRTGQILCLGRWIKLFGSSCTSPSADPTQLSLFPSC